VVFLIRIARKSFFASLAFFRTKNFETTNSTKPISDLIAGNSANLG